MKEKLLTIVALLAFVCGTAMAGDPDERLVEVTLNSGEKVRGYTRSDVKTWLKKLFSKSGSIIQYINVGAQPKGGETKRYSASDVREYRFLQPSESFPDGEVVVSEYINSPMPFKPNGRVRGFAWELDRRENGSVLQWEVWESTGGRNSVSRLVPAVGIKFKGARAAYGIMVNGRYSAWLLMNYLKKAAPEFKALIDERYHKGDEKRSTKEIEENPSVLIALYDEYLQTHEPINDSGSDNDGKKKKDKKKKDKDAPGGGVEEAAIPDSAGAPEGAVTSGASDGAGGSDE